MFDPALILGSRNEYGFGFKSGGFSASDGFGFCKFCLTGFGCDNLI